MSGCGEHTLRSARPTLGPLRSVRSPPSGGFRISAGLLDRIKHSSESLRHIPSTGNPAALRELDKTPR